MKKIFSAISIGVLLFTASLSEAQTPPAERKVNILYETDTYTPPFYRGQALPTGENRITAIAFPDLSGTSLNASALSYRWRKDGEIVGSLSGPGKRLATFSTSLASDSILLEVEVSDPRGAYRARGALYLSDRPTKALLYEEHPLLGILYNTAIPKEFELKGREVSLLAAPIFFSSKRSLRAPAYEWQVNGASVSREKRLTVRAGEGSGKSSITTLISHPDKITQTASFETSVSYEKP